MDSIPWTWLERNTLAAGAFLACVAWENLQPVRPALLAPLRRYGTNLVLGFANAAAVRILFTASAIALARLATERGWGLLPHLGAGPIARAATTIAALDLLAWGLHRLYHVLPLLWRLHAVHHTDRDLNVSSAVRFHPLEIVLSTGIRHAAVILLGADAFGVVLFESLYLTANDWQHANVALSSRTDGWVRRILVTPNMHRTHHSVDPTQTHTNYGVIFSWWDRAFGTHHPLREVAALRLGLPGETSPSTPPPGITRLLGMPFDRHPAGRG